MYSLDTSWLLTFWNKGELSRTTNGYSFYTVVYTVVLYWLDIHITVYLYR